MAGIKRTQHSHWLRPAAVAGATLFAAFPACGASLTARVSDASGKALADAVIYVMPKAGTRLPAQAPRSMAIEQREREFVPYVTPVLAGTTVNFPNRDPLLHHVYSFSPVKTFEIKLYSGDAPRGILFDKPGTVTLGCNIHDWMIGYVHVVETPYFAKTGSDGRARIGDIVPGEFEVQLWHPTQRVAVEAKPVRLEARTSIELDFTIDVSPRKKRFKPPIDGVRYQ